MQLNQVVPAEFLNREKAFSRALPEKFTTNYMLRSWTTGCYFYDKSSKAWIANGMAVRREAKLFASAFHPEIRRRSSFD